MTSSAAPEPIVSSPTRRNPASDGWAALICGLAGVAVFQFFGNANHGYIDTSSLFWWWAFQWINPGSETQHGPLILAVATWLVVRNLRETGDGGRSQESGARSQEDGRNSEAGIQKAESRSQNSGDGGRATGEGRTTDGTGRAARPARPFDQRDGRAARPYLTPAIALIGGLAIHAIGFAAQQARVSIAALLVFTWGVLRLSGGRRWGRAAMFPLAFMVFAVPINVLDSVGFWLRMWVMDASSSLAHLGHITVVQNGTQLMAPDGRYNYDVAAACSGVRSLMALSALSLLIGYLNFRSLWRRAVVLLLCFPLVYVGNVARISAIIFAAQVGGSKWGDAAHAIMGWGIFVIVLGGVLAGAAVFRHVAPETVGAADEGRLKPESRGQRTGGAGGPVRESRDHCTIEARLSRGDPHSSFGIWSERLTAPYIATAIVVVFAIGEMAWLHHLAVLPVRADEGIVLAPDGHNPVDLPTFLGREWVGWPAAVTQTERDILPPDTGFSRMQYVRGQPPKNVLLSIVLSGRDRTSIHRPELCLVGQGWTIFGRERHRFTYPDRPDAAFDATVLRVRQERATTQGRQVVPALVVYWFVGGDRIVATHWQRLMDDSWNRVVHGRTDRWAYVLLMADASDGEAAALSRMQSVLDRALPVFQKAPAFAPRSAAVK